MINHNVIINEDPVILPRRDALGLNEALYYQDLLYRTVKIGAELEFALPRGVRRADFQPVIEELMSPSRSMNQLGKLGIFDVIKEHSGIEVQIIGRHPHWDSLLNQYRKIIPPLLAKGIRMKPTCGLHFHILTIGIAESIPEIILANLWNITRRYAPGLKFLCSAGASSDGLCRRRQHNAHQEFVRLSPSENHMKDIQETLHKSRIVPEHQNFLNLEHVRFGEDGTVSDFHIEMRFPDGDLSPASITAKTFLFFCMVLKAVEISKYGLLDAGDDEEWKRKKRLLDLISNNDGKLASSDTSGITPEIMEEYRINAKRLLRHLKSIFITLDTPAELVLQQLARRPVSLMRDEGMDWPEIESCLDELLEPSFPPDELDIELAKIIELGLVEDATDRNDWAAKAAAVAGKPLDAVITRMSNLHYKNPVWNQELGRMVFSK